MNFHVVEFLEEKEVGVVSDAWMGGQDMCHWPPLRTSAKIAHAVKDHTKPDKSWPTFPCRIMYTASTYEKARKKLPSAEETSDIQTSADEQERPHGKRKIRKNNRYESDISDDDTLTSNPKKKTASLASAPPTPTFRLVCPPSPLQATDADATVPAADAPSTSVEPISESERRTFLLLEEIISAQKTLETKVDKLLCSAKEDPLELETSIIDELGLPVNSLPDLEGVDKKLKEDGRLEQRLVSVYV
ncbi:hypothetical protein HOLleu_42928 [Holothuria leucospilota]|uniref:Uncharacterized protein n=1 Tax=Holothuria leucospilota TaxID=206669 RepID=A0A9Q1BB33_HOLLE|nr:hypothetical protein HOLleu_42928 [Holothuria leucospilota]